MRFLHLISFKLTAINHSANSLNCNKHFILVNRLNNWKHVIPRWFEHRTYSYQKYTLPIKLRNPFLYTRALRLELRIWSLKLPILPIKLYSLPSLMQISILSEKRWLEHPSVKTQYLANILPYLWRLFHT